MNFVFGPFPRAPTSCKGALFGAGFLGTDLSMAGRALAAACIDAYAARVGVSLPLPTQVLALGLTALCDGMHSHGAAEARPTDDTLADTVLVGFITHTVFDRVRG